MYDLSVPDDALDWISSLSDDITCVEQFVRSPNWQREVINGRYFNAEPAALHRYWLERFMSHIPALGHNLLLALAVLREPVAHEGLAEIVEIPRFAHTLGLLQTSPPLVHSDGNRYYIHLNVVLAVLSTAHRPDVKKMHRRVAAYFYSRKDYLAAARHQAAAEEVDEAVDILYRHREDITSIGHLNALQIVARKILQESGNRASVAHKVHAVLACCASLSGKYARAERHWSIALQGELGVVESASCHNRLADAYRLAGKYKQARSEYKAAAALLSYNDHAHVSEYGRAILGLAKVDRLLCQYMEAISHYTEASLAFEEVADELGEIEALFGLGEVDRLRGLWTSAYESYGQSLSRARECGNLEREAYGLWGIGEVLRLTNQPNKAIEAHSAGLDLCIKIGDVRSEGWALLGLAETLRSVGQLDEARRAGEDALRRFCLVGADTESAHARLSLAEIHRLAGEARVDLYSRAESVYNEKSLTHCLVICLIAKAAALRMLSQESEALTLLSRARDMAAERELKAEMRMTELMLSDGTATSVGQFNFP
jgi:tetratricopeptide (TPR) repeat protein